ncbi:MAG: transporter substrate-binding domain-containing protein [Roseiflexus sp.]|nr:transporter substrate-binding domain-containing protein [Roseiflexus sp.]MCS7288629.1 transporter substrate-binding domain-containing protein [Roseiflexus sp.]MDW8146467.1 transporter substrate-binding domain-containing protein [Roseiflexaceae bacterium]MDW8234384.1 transporter substrate-binding domain-containing protein [Roseiflexaceae bacterium]
MHTSLINRVTPIALVLLMLTLAGCGNLGGLLGNQPTPAPIIIIATATPVPPGQATPLSDAVASPTIPSSDTATATSALPTAAPSTPTPAPQKILARVKERGYLICGTNADLPGFGFYDSIRQTWSGFDVDFCRAVAAAIFGDATKVQFVALSAAPGPNNRFDAVRQGRVDVLFRNTTWTLGRNISGLAFGPTTFHDGQTFMVRAKDRITKLEDLEGKIICVARGTTSEQNLNEDFAARGIKFTARVLDGEDELYPAYDEGECDAVTSDSSQLAAKRLQLKNPAEHIILGDRISREPLGPVIARDDNQWLDVISWTVFATIYAEELRVDQRNVDRLRASTTDPRIRRLLGLEGNFGEGLGLPNDFAYQIIKQVGNYGDIYNRNLGPNTPINLDRGPNKVWNLGAGGVLSAPPFR